MDNQAGFHAREGVTMHRINIAIDISLSLLRAKLYAGSARAVVLIAADRLVDAPAGGEKDLGVPALDPAGNYEPTLFTREAAAWLKLAAPGACLAGAGRTRLSASFDGLVGGCIGPIRYDRSWYRGVLRATVPEIDNSGIETLARRTSDPAMVTTARWINKGCSIGLREACAFVAWSLADRRDHGPEVQTASIHHAASSATRRLYCC